MFVAQTAPATFHQDLGFVVFCNFENYFAGFSIFYNCSERNFNCYVLTIGARTFLFSAWAANSGFNVALIFKMEQSPHLRVALYNYMAAATTIATIGSAICNKFLSSHVG